MADEMRKRGRQMEGKKEEAGERERQKDVERYGGTRWKLKTGVGKWRENERKSEEERQEDEERYGSR